MENIRQSARQSDEELPAPETELWNKGFEVSSVSRTDLVQAGVPQQLVATLTDIQMEYIAAKMGDYYSDQYWDHLAAAVEHITGTIPIGPEEESAEAFPQGLGDTHLMAHPHNK